MVVVFLAAALYFYFRPSFNADKFLASFLVLLVVSLLIRWSIVNNQWSIVIVIFLGFLFFILLGIKNLIFIKRESLYHFLNNLLLLIIFILFFRSSPYHLFFIKYLLLIFAIGLLSKEFLNFLIPELLPSQKKKVIIWGTSFLIAQFIWAINLLPINFLNAAALSFLAMFILQDFVIHHFSGTINRQIILRNITVFLVLTLIICGASKWSP